MANSENKFWPNHKVWPAPMANQPITAVVNVPGSKSQSNRSMVLAAAADEPSTLSGILDSRDTRLMAAGLERLGAQVSQTGQDQLTITPPNKWLGSTTGIDCGLAGTVMRFLPPFAMLADSPTHFFGDVEATVRPMAPILDGMSQLGAKIDNNTLPFTVIPPTKFGHTITIDSSGSSQFISGLLLVGAKLPHGLTLQHQGAPIPSRPHIDMTIQMLLDRQVVVDAVTEDSWRVEPGPVAALDEQIEPDLTTAAMFLAAAAITGGQVTVTGWPAKTVQAGDEIQHWLAAFGAQVELSERGLTVSGTGHLTSQDVDLSDASELVPVVAAVAAFSHGITRIRGVGHIRGHETNRIAALVEMLSQVGVSAKEMPDGLEIEGARPESLKGDLLKSSADHRMVHAAALLGLLIPNIEVDEVGCTSKTLPDFPTRWAQLVGVN